MRGKKEDQQDDTLTLETLCLFVTLSEEGVICYDKPPQNDPDESNLDEWH